MKSRERNVSNLQYTLIYLQETDEKKLPFLFLQALKLLFLVSSFAKFHHFPFYILWLMLHCFCEHVCGVGIHLMFSSDWGSALEFEAKCAFVCFWGYGITERTILKETLVWFGLWDLLEKSVSRNISISQF